MQSRTIRGKVPDSMDTKAMAEDRARYERDHAYHYATGKLGPPLPEGLAADLITRFRRLPAWHMPARDCGCESCSARLARGGFLPADVRTPAEVKADARDYKRSKVPTLDRVANNARWLALRGEAKPVKVPLHAARIAALEARCAELEGALREALSQQTEAPIPPSREVVDEGRVRDLEAQVAGFLRWGVAS